MAVKDTPVAEAEDRLRPKRRKVLNLDSEVSGGAAICNNEDGASVSRAYTVSDLRRSQRITPSELLKREKALLSMEQECKRKSDELDERILSISRKEDEASLMMSRLAEREATVVLGQLEEHFTCALLVLLFLHLHFCRHIHREYRCYEIMAHPYTLNPGQCGHTFCALCILKWFFSRLHRACGGWHESVDCPICRSLLVITPDRVPRLDITFPFVPNRTAAAVCESLIEKLAQFPSDPSIVKREDSEGFWGSGSKPGWSSDCGSKKGKSKKEEEIQDNADVAGWREGGIVRAEWLKKDRQVAFSPAFLDVICASAHSAHILFYSGRARKRWDSY